MIDNAIMGNLIFQERYAMAVSHKNTWTKLVNTWKCIEVNLSPQYLQVRLHGLFGAVVKIFAADLDHTVPLSSVISVEDRRKFMGYREISVVFHLPEGGERELLLYLKRGEEFTNLLSSMIGK